MGPAFLLCSVALIPWIVYLALSLPSRQVSSHYDVAWVGFDVFELIALGEHCSKTERRAEAAEREEAGRRA